MRLKPLIASVSFLIGASAYAASVPQSNGYDSRMREVIYNANDIVRVQGTFGQVTRIIFAPDETIRKSALGDTLAWETATVDNSLFLKPTEANADTNMSVLTNKRSYEFELVTVDKGKGQVFYQVKFSYPNEETAKLAQEQETQDRALAYARAEVERTRKQAEQQAKLANAMKDAEIPVRKSINYWLKGSAEVTPDEAYDDGTFTYFRYKGNREFPVVYLQDEKGNESLVNTTVKGDTILVQRIAERYVLRKGNDVAQVVNPNYDRIGVNTGTGTITTAVTRITKGESDPLPETLPTQPTTTKTATAISPAPEHVEPTRTVPPTPPPAAPAAANEQAPPPIQAPAPQPHADPVGVTPHPTQDASADDSDETARNIITVPAQRAGTTPTQTLNITRDGHIRSAPTTSATIIGSAFTGATYHVLSTNAEGDWYQIDQADTAAWVSKQIATLNPTNSEPLPASEAATPAAPAKPVTVEVIPARAEQHTRSTSRRQPQPHATRVAEHVAATPAPTRGLADWLAADPAPAPAGTEDIDTTRTPSRSGFRSTAEAVIPEEPAPAAKEPAAVPAAAALQPKQETPRPTPNGAAHGIPVSYHALWHSEDASPSVNTNAAPADQHATTENKP